MHRIPIGPRVGLSDLESWKTLDPVIEFTVSKNSGFQVFVEGVATSWLYQLVSEGTRIEIATTCNVLQNPDAGELSDGLSFFRSLFGSALIHMATVVRDDQGEVRTAALRELAWREITTGRGHIGSGALRCLVAREPDLPVPECLIESSRAQFPSRRRFVSWLAECGRKLGAGQEFGATRTEESVATFLYEAARNSHEHGRHAPEFSRRSGIRGVIAQKIRVARQGELAGRTDLSPFLKDYFERAWAFREKDLLFVAFTVTDFGPGIHRSLPPIDGELPRECLARAFLPGESRKPSGSALGRGEGLPKLLEAYRGLKALLFVQAAELLTFADFSLLSPSSDISEVAWGDFPERHPNRIGTSLTLVWPVDTDRQGELEFPSGAEPDG
ncbi:MAG: hypothetical protein WD942_01930 [Dehalococcoidia bacterium]